MDSLNRLLNKRINQLGLKKPFEAAKIVSVANRLANRQYTALSFSRGILVVSCPSSIAAQEVQLRHPEIISAINKTLGSPLVKRLSFRIKPE